MITPSGSADVAIPTKTEDPNETREPKGPSPAPPESPDVDREVIESALEQSGRDIVFGGRAIQFNYDRDANRVIVKVVSQDNEEIVREIPPKEYVQFVSRFRELMGVIFDETA